MPGTRTKKNYKRWLSITLIILCCASPLAPMLGVPVQPAIAQGQGPSSFNSCSASQPYEATMFALTDKNTLLNFNPGQPGMINSVRFITGLSSGENLVGIDFRPANGQLYGLSTANRIYTINPSTGAATAVGTAAIATALNGQSFGIDFNPTVDRIRVVSNAGQNFRINPNNGVIANAAPPDMPLAFAPTDPNATQTPNVVGSAYTNNFSGSTSTTLYGIDSNRDALVTQGTAAGVTPPVSPNSGQLFTVGGLGVDTNDMVGFDISPVTNAAFASLTPPGARTSNLYTINLTTGAATLVGPIGGRGLIRDIAYAVRPETVYALTAGGKLIRFNPGVPGAISSSLSISGLGSGESLVGIDFRPATGVLYALSNASRTYTINTRTGVATQVGAAPLATALNGQSFGVDFNPVVDRIRVVSDANQNFRINPNNGAIANAPPPDMPLTFAPADPNAAQTPNVVGSAYTNSFLGASSTTLYGIDSNLNALVTQGTAAGVTPAVSPNMGQLFTVGSLGTGVDPNGVLGFDISSETGVALASFNRLYMILIDSSKAIAIRVNRSSGFTLNGNSFGFDFNPVPDRIRLVSDGGQNIRLNPNDGTVANAAPADMPLAFAPGDPNAGQNPGLVGSAYTNSFQGSTTTTLFGINPAAGVLVRQGSAPGVTPVVSPNMGQLFTIGSLGVAANGGQVDFDIASPSNAGFASLTPQGANQSQFYTVNLVTGAATLIGPIGSLNEPVQGIAIGGFSRAGGYDVCIQDDRSGSTLQFDSCTGDFQVTKCGRGGFLFTGKGDTTRLGNLMTLRADRVFALVNISPMAQARSGLAVVKSGRVFTINDRDTTNNTCRCR